MRVKLLSLTLTNRKSIEIVQFSHSVTFLYGPVGTGKSTVARLIDYCFGGDLERTAAIKSELLSATLDVELGGFRCAIERSATDTQSVRVTWEQLSGPLDAATETSAESTLESPALQPENTVAPESVNATIAAGPTLIAGEQVCNLSDLLFYLCGVAPIKVRKSRRDWESPLVRLSFRDIWWYCYLEQEHLDSSFFRLEDPFKGRKSQDAMRFFTGLHSQRMNELEQILYAAIDEQKGKREAAKQIRQFMEKFELGSEVDVEARIEAAKSDLIGLRANRTHAEVERSAAIHPTEFLRASIRSLDAEIAEIAVSISEMETTVSEQRALKAEFVTAKLKSARSEWAGDVLGDVPFKSCPRCSADISSRVSADSCTLCCSPIREAREVDSVKLEAARRELNDRIDQIADSIARRQKSLARAKKQLILYQEEKRAADYKLSMDLRRYDSAAVETLRELDRKEATLQERVSSLERLQMMPKAISDLEDEAEMLQATIDRTRFALQNEAERLRFADSNVTAIADRFKQIMVSIGFPGVSKDDEVIIDTRSWRPEIHHGDQDWNFWEAGSGGKKTLFNVCYALAIHETARERGLPVPSVLVIDSPTKNISEDENPALVQSLYQEIYRIAQGEGNQPIQFLLIDSDLASPTSEELDFASRHLAGTPEDPSLISYYVGP